MYEQVRLRNAPMHIRYAPLIKYNRVICATETTPDDTPCSKTIARLLTINVAHVATIDVR